MAHGFLIDGQGAAWPDHSWALARRIGYVDPAIDVSAFAVRDRGFIHVRSCAEGARVSLRAGAFTAAAFTGALHALAGLEPKRVMLAALHGKDWSYRMFFGVWELAEYAEALVRPGPEMPRERLSEDLRRWHELFAPVTSA